VNGYEPDRIPEEEIPHTITFRIVLIEVSNNTSDKSGRADVHNGLKSAGVDVYDYEAVMNHFKLKP